MARTAKRRRRLWDTYAFPGFRPQPTVHGIFGEPKARVITLNRRSKKQPAAVAVASTWAGTTGRCAAYAICRAGTLGYFSNWKCGGSSAAVAARSNGNGSSFWRTIRSTPSALLTMWATLPAGDDQGRGGRIGSGLAHGQGAGPAIHGSAAQARWHAWSAGHRRRRACDPQRSHLPDRGERPDPRSAELVRWR